MKNSKPAYRRHYISDETWALLESHLPGRKGVWGGIATRYAKNSASFLAAIQIRCIALWLKIS